MSKIYHPRITRSLREDGVSYWIEEADEQLVGERVYVRIGSQLMDQRDDWHETKPAALEEAAVRIEAIAGKLLQQAGKIREQSRRIRNQERDDDERYDRGLPPQTEAAS